MKIRILILLAAVLPVGSAWAQLPPIFFQPLAQIKQFLQLSDAQLQTILADNDDFNRFSADKQNRIRQVQTEIADETGKSPLDPNALGIRYAEIEGICREIKDKAATSQKQNLAVLSDVQKSRLNILSDALKLAPVISEAQYGNLIPYGFGFSSSNGYAGFLLGGVTSFANGCSLPFPVTPIIIGQVPTSVSGVSRAGDRATTTSIPPKLVVCTGNALYCGDPWFDRTDFVPQRVEKP